VESYARAVTAACTALQNDMDSIRARADLHCLIRGIELSGLLVDQSPAAVTARRAVIDFMGEVAADASRFL
jgi:succinylglutamate desuccinylase